MLLHRYPFTPRLLLVYTFFTNKFHECSKLTAPISLWNDLFVYGIQWIFRPLNALLRYPLPVDLLSGSNSLRPLFVKQSRFSVYDPCNEIHISYNEIDSAASICVRPYEWLFHSLTFGIHPFLLYPLMREKIAISPRGTILSTGSHESCQHGER